MSNIVTLQNLSERFKTGAEVFGCNLFWQVSYWNIAINSATQPSFLIWMCENFSTSGFSSSLDKGKLCRLNLLLLLLTSDHDQGEKRKRHPSDQKSLHLYRQQVESQPSASVDPTAAPLVFKLRTSLCEICMLSPSQRLGLLFTVQSQRAMLVGCSKQKVSPSSSYFQQTANPARLHCSIVK